MGQNISKKDIVEAKNKQISTKDTKLAQKMQQVKNKHDKLGQFVRTDSILYYKK